MVKWSDSFISGRWRDIAEIGRTRPGWAGTTIQIRGLPLPRNDEVSVPTARMDGMAGTPLIEAAAGDRCGGTNPSGFDRRAARPLGGRRRFGIDAGDSGHPISASSAHDGKPRANFRPVPDLPARFPPHRATPRMDIGRIPRRRRVAEIPSNGNPGRAAPLSDRKILSNVRERA